MAIYNPDYRLIEATKIIKKLDPKDKRDILIKYYIEKMELYEKEQEKKLKEYQDFFSSLSKLLPNHNIRF